MSFWTAIVVIVAIIAWANIRMTKHRGESRPGQDIESQYTASLEREVADLRKRLEVLERIATDDRETKRLAQEIEALRDR
ncbi:hypothetical protein OLX02_01800 [Novosphingobium sp. KCTC 2891]|uniref:hypothetical protein n=1 Tax=Novosphingobium sp. KCTC 2891 TaxID=2989730 RepID=UPI002222732E|nr:hypothetical protein [Novosphingobium sp. KCTC 2891]MCW1381547.1 hypothetical protein [Novosphingobium sp. KCTC 2891]